MKVMYLLFSFTVGGTERLVSNICNEMTKKGNEVHLYIVNDNVDKALLDTIDSRVNIALAKRIAGGSEKVKTLINISNYIKTNRIEIVHVNSLKAPELLLLAKFFNPRVKVFYTVHGLNQYSHLSFLEKVYRNWICSKIIGISNGVSADIISAGASKRKNVTIYNALDMSAFEKNEEKSKECLTIGCVARIDNEIKGQDILVKALPNVIRKYKNVNCIFAGAPAKGCEKDLVYLKEYIENNGIKEHVTFAGMITDVPLFLKDIDIFVLPSRFEGFGLSIVEAMASGIPCIASDVAGPKEVLEDGKLGVLFKNGDPRDLSEKISAMVERYTSYKKQANDITEYVRSKYDIKKMCSQLEILYKS